VGQKNETVTATLDNLKRFKAKIKFKVLNRGTASAGKEKAGGSFGHSVSGTCGRTQSVQVKL